MEPTDGHSFQHLFLLFLVALPVLQRLKSYQLHFPDSPAAAGFRCDWGSANLHAVSGDLNVGLSSLGRSIPMQEQAAMEAVGWSSFRGPVLHGGSGIVSWSFFSAFITLSLITLR